MKAEIAPMQEEKRYLMWFVDDASSVEGAGLYFWEVYDRFAGRSDNYALEVESHVCVELSAAATIDTPDVTVNTPARSPGPRPHPGAGRKKRVRAR